MKIGFDEIGEAGEHLPIDEVQNVDHRQEDQERHVVRAYSWIVSACILLLVIHRLRPPWKCLAAFRVAWLRWPR